MRIWDLVVVGAGPAGSAAALAARRERPDAGVLLLDRATFPRDKSCGDGVAPHVLDVARELGVSGLAAGHRPVTRLHLGFADGRHVAGEMTRPAHVVPRAVLDDRLRSAALAAGAEPGLGAVRRLDRHDGWVEVDGSGDAAGLVARRVVAADGATGTVRASLGIPAPRAGHVAVAIRGYAPVRPDLAAEQRIVFADGGDWPAYAWSFPVGDGSANVGYGEVLRAGRRLTRAGLLSRLEELLPGVSAGARAWRAHHLPLSSDRPRQPDGDVLLAGDAMSLVNPMTGEGLYYAVLSGSLAGRAAVRGGDAGASYRAALGRELGTHLRHTSAATALARMPGIVPAALRAASADRRVFDSLVELGLGRGLLVPSAIAGIAGALARPRPGGSPQSLSGDNPSVGS